MMEPTPEQLEAVARRICRLFDGDPDVDVDAGDRDWARQILAALNAEPVPGKTVGSLPEGWGGYTVPWAMWVDADRNCWLNTSYNVDSRHRGTMRMWVERVSGGYRVVVPAGEKYRPSDLHGFCGDPQFAPVVEIHEQAKANEKWVSRCD